MPEMDGLAFSRAVYEKNRVIQIVILSGEPLPPKPEVNIFPSQNIVAWLQKPVSIEQLAQVVSRALK